MLIFRNMHMRIPIGLSLFDEDLSGEVNDHHIGVYRRDKLIGVWHHHAGKQNHRADAAGRHCAGIPQPWDRPYERLFAEERTAALGFPA